jgi:hypothetical protein
LHPCNVPVEENGAVVVLVMIRNMPFLLGIMPFSCRCVLELCRLVPQLCRCVTDNVPVAVLWVPPGNRMVAYGFASKRGRWNKGAGIWTDDSGSRGHGKPRSLYWLPKGFFLPPHPNPLPPAGGKGDKRKELLPKARIAGRGRRGAGATGLESLCGAGQGSCQNRWEG